MITINNKKKHLKEDIELLLKLWNTSGVGVRTLDKFIFKLRETGKKLFEVQYLDRKKLRDLGLSARSVKDFKTGSSNEKSIAENLFRNHVDVHLKDDLAYPHYLSNFVDNPPPVLFTRNNVELLSKPTVGFCGSRDVSEQGIEIAHQCSSILVEAGFNVISGHARGVDKAAHATALSEGGTTTIVPAEGILKFSPDQNMKEIISPNNHLIISSFFPTARWTAYRAMERNSLICGLSDAMILVESGKEGGTFEAGKTTLEMGKPLFVIDYGNPPDSAVGNEFFLKYGGKSLRRAKNGEPNVEEVIKVAKEFFEGRERKENLKVENMKLF